MNAIKLNRAPIFFAFGIPFVIILISFVLAFNSLLIIYPELAVGITLDLTLASPLIYLFFIRKTKIPKITVVPFFTGGVIIAGFLVPDQQQFHLNLIKVWILPLIEIGGLGFIGFSVYKTVKTYKTVKKSHTDIYRIIQEVSKKTAPIPFLAQALAFEVAVFYYCFIGWKGFRPSEKIFSYHKKSGTIVLMGAVIFIIGVETVIFHILVAQWDGIIAWILTILSFYFLIQIFAHTKAVYQRPIEITGDKLIVRYGLFGDSVIDLENISSVEFSTNFEAQGTDAKQAAMLPGFEQFNTVIHLKRKETYAGFYGIKSKYKTLLLFLDEKDRFKKLIEKNDSD